MCCSKTTKGRGRHSLRGSITRTIAALCRQDSWTHEEKIDTLLTRRDLGTSFVNIPKQRDVALDKAQSSIGVEFLQLVNDR